ncbi:hypothetical protein AN189_02905 [Loktanella sp. 3ANDIMAR09]|uniref:hypothetical protein n=1 Tax=Loktanella sp. 3ANDIMAR09 TaxID=1225657 RepID=UPI0006F86717|nr:hypothetical protein [Loktanella sp. 3ANDIMAR09]KQI69390.1 hypothetical protein AN189_02905 [Loktanella sp. 3ANDIMAR09]
MPNTPGFRIEVFRTGTFKPMSGDAISYTAEDLAGIVDAYDPDNAPAPVVIGHPSVDAPAYGWVSGFEYDADADRLYADIDELEPAFADAVKEGRFKKVSMSFHTPDAPNNPTPGKWYAKHVGFLGGAAPAVSGLKPIRFAAAGKGEAVTFEAKFGEAGFQDTASMFRGLRDWFIEQFGLEAADRVLPAYRIEWLDERELSTKPDPDPTPSFTAPPTPKPEKDPAMDPAEIARREKKLKDDQAALDTRAATLAKQEAAARTLENAAFAETLVTDGKLAPAARDRFTAILDALPADQSVSFAEGGEQPVIEALKALMSEQPKIIDFGQTDLGEEPGEFADDAQKIASFAATYRKEQEAAGNPISISEAVAHVIKGAAK